MREWKKEMSESSLLFFALTTSQQECEPETFKKTTLTSTIKRIEITAPQSEFLGNSADLFSMIIPRNA